MEQNGLWTVFDPTDTGDLDQLWGGRFAARYAQYENAHAEALRMPASDLWSNITAAQGDYRRVRAVFSCTLNSKQVGNLHSSC